MSRPEAIFPLFASLETLPGVGDKTAKLLPISGSRNRAACCICCRPR